LFDLSNADNGSVSSHTSDNFYTAIPQDLYVNASQIEIPAFLDDDQIVQPPLQGILLIIITAYALLGFSYDELPPDGKSLSALAQLSDDDDD
jgi:hypothetical protein